MGWSTVSLGNSWAKSNGTQVLRFSYYNDSAIWQKLTKVSCLLGSGKGTAWSNSTSTYNGDGNNCTAVLKYFGIDNGNGKPYSNTPSDIGTATATVSASVAGTKDSNNAYFYDSNGDGLRTAPYTDAAGNYHEGESGYFPLNGDSKYKVTFNLTSSIDVAPWARIYFAVARSNSAAGPILTAHRASNQSISGTVTNYTCTISNVAISPAVIVPGGSVTASATGDSGSSKSYQWYNKNNEAISGATSATRTANAGDYCKITITKDGYVAASGTTAAVKHYGKPTQPTGLTIIGSKADERYTNREDYTFSWNASSAGSNGNNVDGYTYWICANNDDTKITGTTNASTTSVTKTASQLVSNIALNKGDSLYFWVQASGSANYDSDWAKSNSVPIVSAAVMHVKVGTTWHEGIVYVKNGNSWVEATEVKVKNSSGQWKDSI